MLKRCVPMLVLLALFCAVFGSASSQVEPGQGEQVAGSVAIARALKASSLTEDGTPFHALMDIGTTAPYTGRIEVWWLSPTRYHLVITSPGFSQTKTVNGDKVQEKDEGSYYPRWLENFVLALLDPLPMAKNFGAGTVTLGPQLLRSCLGRNDRPGGITDQMTWGQICFSGSEPKLAYVLTMNDSMEFKDWERFGNKEIARTYQTSVLDYKPVLAQLTRLDKLEKPDDQMFVVTDATPAAEQIATSFVSTAQEESLLETRPDIHWPTVREGRTDGFMIVYARTDRTGQVRETAKHNSDQPALESFGMEQALLYKFKPLVVNGVAQQMEMPLVLHFSSNLADPLPVLSVAEMKKQMRGCEIGSLPPGTAKGTVITVRVSVDETGKVLGMGPVGNGHGRDWLAAMSQVRYCRLARYVVNGKATNYKGDVELVAR